MGDITAAETDRLLEDVESLLHRERRGATNNAQHDKFSRMATAVGDARRDARRPPAPAAKGERTYRSVDEFVREVFPREYEKRRAEGKCIRCGQPEPRNRILEAVERITGRSVKMPAPTKET